MAKTSTPAPRKRPARSEQWTARSRYLQMTTDLTALQMQALEDLSTCPKRSLGFFHENGVVDCSDNTWVYTPHGKRLLERAHTAWQFSNSLRHWAAPRLLPANCIPSGISPVLFNLLALLEERGAIAFLYLTRYLYINHATLEEALGNGWVQGEYRLGSAWQLTASGKAKLSALKFQNIPG
jgi:hypothetical protein